MRPLVWDRLDFIARSIFPFLITLTLVMAGALPRVPDLSQVVPALPLIAVYYWSVHLPRLMPLWAIFLIGLAQDLLTGGPLGVATITLMSVSVFIGWRRRDFFQAGFVMVWMLFMFIAAGAFGLMWLLNSLGMLRALDGQPLMFQYLLTVAVYPCFAWLMARGQRLFRR